MAGWLAMMGGWVCSGNVFVALESVGKSKNEAIAATHETKIELFVTSGAVTLNCHAAQRDLVP